MSVGKVLMFIFLWGVVFLASLGWGKYQMALKDELEYEIKILRRNAVDQGYATWEVDVDGNTSFKWNTEDK